MMIIWTKLACAQHNKSNLIVNNNGMKSIEKHEQRRVNVVEARRQFNMLHLFLQGEHNLCCPFPNDVIAKIQVKETIYADFINRN